MILESLYKQLAELINVQVKNESRLESCKLPKHGANKSEVSLKSGEQFSCDLLVSFQTFLFCEDSKIMNEKSSILLFSLSSSKLHQTVSLY